MELLHISSSAVFTAPLSTAAWSRNWILPEVADDAPAGLKSFLNGNTDALHCRSCGLYDLDQTLERASVGEEIVYDEHMILRCQEFLRYGVRNFCATIT